MQTVEQIAAAIVAREGGFVDDPDDPGGATNHGVTIGTMRGLGLDLDGSGRVDAADVRRLDPAQAARIYVEHYFRRPRLDRLPAMVQASVFDMQVNAGANAVKILQRLVSRMGFACTYDGVVDRGPRPRPRPPPPPPPRIWPMPTGSPGAAITMPWPTRALPAASSPAVRTAARAAGSTAPRSSSRPAIT